MTNTQSTAAESVSRTVWMLGQLRGFSTKQELAKAMNWERTRLSRTLSGARQWTLEDLVEVAEVLGLSGPGDLFRPLSELVGAVQPAAAAASVRRGDRALYRGSARGPRQADRASGRACRAGQAREGDPHRRGLAEHTCGAGRGPEGPEVVSDEHDYSRMSPEEIEREWQAAQERAKTEGPEIEQAVKKTLARLEELRKGRKS